MSHLNTYQRVKPKSALLAKVLALGLVLVFFGCEQESPPKAATGEVRIPIQMPAADKTPEKKIAPAAPAEKADAKAGDAQTTAADQTTKQEPDRKSVV